MQKTKVVIFDVDDTLYSFTEANKIAFSFVSEYTYKEFGWNQEKTKSLHDNMMTCLMEKMGEVGASHNRYIRWQNILENEGLPIFHAIKIADIYWAHLIDSMVPYPYLEETLIDLKAHGIKLGIGTNMTCRIQLKKLEKLNIIKYIDFAVTSEEAGADKPLKKFFDMCIQKASCTPSECTFVGDSLFYDINGALNASLNAIWLQIENPAPKEKAPCPIAKDYKELKRLIIND